jgi:hypothetical protein
MLILPPQFLGEILQPNMRFLQRIGEEFVMGRAHVIASPITA